MRSTSTFLGFALTFVLVSILALFIVGLRVNDRPRGDISHRDPTPMLRGFESDAVRVGAAAFATDIAVSPDGLVFVAEHLSGQIKLLAPDRQEAGDSLVAQVNLPEGGRLLHLAVHPAWPAQPYLYYTALEGTGPNQRLGLFRLRVEGGLGVDALRLFGDLPTEDPRRGPEADHFGSAIAVCGQFLYLSVGDTDSPGPGSYRPGGVRFRAQDVSQAEGKILRYRVEGAEVVPAGVLFPQPPVYALGFRNVFSLDCDAASTVLLAADNGPAGHDQLRLVSAGSNHGWPDSDERTTPTAPLLDTGGAAIAPTGVVLRVDGAMREALFSSFHTQAIYRIRFDAAGLPVGPVELAHRATGPVLSLGESDDGCVFFSTADAIWLLRERTCDLAGGFSTVPGGSSGQMTRFDEAPAETFAANCSACHGLDREGGGAPSLLGSALTKSDDFYVATILNGREGGMPSWGAAGMSEEQARAMLDYLRSAPE